MKPSPANTAQLVEDRIEDRNGVQVRIRLYSNGRREEVLADLDPATSATAAALQSYSATIPSDVPSAPEPALESEEWKAKTSGAVGFRKDGTPFTAADAARNLQIMQEYRASIAPGSGTIDQE